MPPTPDPHAPVPETEQPGHESGADALDELAHVKSEVRAVLADLSPHYGGAKEGSIIKNNLDRLRRASN